jgi:hypothetical protein
MGVRAFASFLLLLASLPLLAPIAVPLPPAPELSSAISLERAYYDSAGLKDAILESARLGALDAKKEYFARISAGDKEADLAKLVKRHVHERLATLFNSLPPNAAIWCGPISEESLTPPAIGASESEPLTIPSGASPLESPYCADFIQVDPVAMQLWLEMPTSALFDEAQGIGISLYSNGISHVSYVPISKRVGFG